MNEKELLRRKYINLRKLIEDKEIKSKIIIDKLNQLDEFKKARVIALYNSLKDEVHTDLLIKDSLKEKIVLLPKVEKDNIAFYQITKNEDLIKSSFNILEPIGDINKLYKKEYIDLFIVPGICFDKNKNRLGFGKGYYDRYLCDKDNTIGICYDEQIVNLLPTNKYDVKMKKIITDKRVF